MLARPGADFGYVLALLAANREKGLGLSPQACFDAVYEAVTRRGEHFFLHTDQHADPSHGAGDGARPLIGCGHIAGALSPEHAAAYGVDPDEVRVLVEHALALARRGRAVELVTLVGEHQERGVLVVHGIARTVASFDGNSMYFAYDPDRDDAFLSELAAAMAIAGVTADDLRRQSRRQLDAALRRLAPGLPVYDVSFSNGEPVVALARTVERS
jgi:hypothetical protein